MSVQDGAVLRTASRLLSGGHMEPRSMLLEHTLVMPGETVDTETVVQGWPSRKQLSRIAFMDEAASMFETSESQTVFDV